MAITKKEVLDLLKGFTVGGTIGVLLWLGSDELGSIEKMVEQYQNGKGEEISYLVQEHQNDITQANTTIENYKQALSQANGNIEEMTRLYEELLEEFGGFVQDTNDGYDEIYAQANETLEQAQETFNEQRNEVQKANEEVVATHQKVEELIESDDYTVSFEYGVDENGNDIITDTTVTFNKTLDETYRDEMIGQNVTEVTEGDLQVSTNKYLTGTDKGTGSGEVTYTLYQNKHTTPTGYYKSLSLNNGTKTVGRVVIEQCDLNTGGKVIVRTYDENEVERTYSEELGYNVPTSDEYFVDDFGMVSYQENKLVKFEK